MSKPYSGLSLTGLVCAATLFIGTVLAGCSGSNEDTSGTNSATPETQTSAPASQPATNPHTAAPVTNANTTPPANNLPTGGKVIKAMHAGGYTYMQVENDGKEFWIASTMLNVKRNDRVTWADAAVMKDFKSTTLRRTFDEILFVSSAQIEQ